MTYAVQIPATLVVHVDVENHKDAVAKATEVIRSNQLGLGHIDGVAGKDSIPVTIWPQLRSQMAVHPVVHLR